MWSVEVARGGNATVVTSAASLYVRPAFGMGLAAVPTPAFADLPQVLAVDSAGNFFVLSRRTSSESGSKALLSAVVRKFSPNGQPLPFGPDGTAGVHMLDGLTAAAMDPADANFVAPASIATNATGTLYLGDAAGNRVLKRTADGTTIVLGSARFDSEVENSPAPNQLAVDRAGTVYLASRTDRVVARLNADGSTAVLAGASGNPRAGADGAGASASFTEPSSPVVDAHGNIYVADMSTVRKTTPSGSVTTVGVPPQAPAQQVLPLLKNLRMGADGTFYAAWGAILRARAL